MYKLYKISEKEKMKNKIIVFMLSAMILLASLAIGVGAANLKSDVFTLTADETLIFEMKKCELPTESADYINSMFDKTFYDATIYGAYNASLSDADGLAVAFTNGMDVSINIGEDLYDTEVFVFAIDKNSGKASPVLKSERDGANLIIKGEDFAPISDDIIVVMTSNQSLMTGPEYTYIPAAVCAGVAVIAITVSVLVVKKKSSKETITG
jgi:hypothetical protein